MTQTPINWNELVADVATEVRGGSDIETAIAEVAGDYDANPTVLRARFEKAFPEGVPAITSAKDAVEAKIVETCARYRTTREGCVGPIRTTTGRTVTCIGRYGNQIVAVDMGTGAVRMLGFGTITGAAMRMAGLAA